MVYNKTPSKLQKATIAEQIIESLYVQEPSIVKNDINESLDPRYSSCLMKPSDRLVPKNKRTLFE